MKTMLQIIQAATGEMGLVIPNAVASSLAADTVQQLALLNRVGNRLAREYNWQALDKEYRFTTSFTTTTGNVTNGSAVVTNIPSTTGLVAGAYMAVGTGINQDTYIQSVDSSSQVTLSQNCNATGTGITINFCKTKYAYPSDYDRPVDRTQWDKSKHWEMLGPLTAQQWQYLKSGYIATGPRIRYRNLGNTFQIWPPISTAEYIGFEYISNAWATSASGTAQTSFIADSDTCIYPDNLMIVGLKNEYFTVKGLGDTYAAEYSRELNIAKANDGGGQTLSMAPRPTSILIQPENIPDSGYGS